MNSLGHTIRRLRQGHGVTQEQLAEYLHISSQAISKWENDAALPDIMLLPLLADYFSVSIDELFCHKLQAYTYKERFIKLMYDSGVMYFRKGSYPCRIDTELFSTNAQIAQIGECFADFIRENHLDFDAIMGLAYHGIAFSAATAFSLYQKYGVTTGYFHDRRVPDSQVRAICGYTPKDGDRIIVINDLTAAGQTLEERLDQLFLLANVEIAAVIVIADMQRTAEGGLLGSDYIARKYNTRVYSVITAEDIKTAVRDGVIPAPEYPLV